MITFFLDGDYVYRQDENMTAIVGMKNITSTERINNETVVDISYEFDLELGFYVEQSRVERAESLPPVPIPVEDKVEILDERTLGMQAIDDFTLQAQANIDDRTVGMQAIDDFTLEMVTALQTQVAQLQAEIDLLKGGA